MRNNEQEIKIFSFYHKNIPAVIKDELYCPIMVGSALSSGVSNFQRDDEGENISDRNQYYCEMTGIYWAWKNCNSDIAGTSHYRRYFTAQPEPLTYKIKRFLYYFILQHRKRRGLIYNNNPSLFIPRIINKEEIEDLLSQYDAILPQARKLRKTIKDHYNSHHNGYGLDILEDIIRTKHPDFLDSFNGVMNSNRLYANNMFILRNNHFQEFMEWWFDILFEFEERVKKHKADYPKRIIGFVAERILNVWFHKKQLNCIELPIIYFKQNKITT